MGAPHPRGVVLVGDTVEEKLARLFQLVGGPVVNPGLDDRRIDLLWAETGLPMPADYRALLRVFDGQEPGAALTFPPGKLEFLSLEGAVALWRALREFEDDPSDDLVDDGRVRSMVYHPRRFPIAEYEVGVQDLFLDFIPGERGREGQVVFNPSEATFYVVAESVSRLIDDYVAILEQGQAKIVDDGGLRRFVTASGEPLTFERYMQLVKG
jgi:cell wall assembly regulator SMI1